MTILVLDEFQVLALKISSFYFDFIYQKNSCFVDNTLFFCILRFLPVFPLTWTIFLFRFFVASRFILSLLLAVEETEPG